jgi:hypothetical protein
MYLPSQTSGPRHSAASTKDKDYNNVLSVSYPFYFATDLWREMPIPRNDTGSSSGFDNCPKFGSGVSSHDLAPSAESPMLEFGDLPRPSTPELLEIARARSSREEGSRQPNAMHLQLSPQAHVNNVCVEG